MNSVVLLPARISLSAARPHLAGFLREAFRRERILAGAGLLLAAAMAPTLFAYLVDVRLLNGINVWTKPLKFEASVALFFVTLAWFWAYLPRDVAARRWIAAIPVTIATVGIAEVAYIAIQAGRGVASHFNESTPLEATLFHLMGVGAVIMTLGSLALGILIARSGRQGLSPAFRRSVVAGLVLTFALGAGAGIVIAVNGGHWVGGVHSDAGGPLIFGWARDGGDLRVGHFFGIHAMQALPLFALIVERAMPRRAALLVAIFTLAYAALTLAVLAQALAGQPFLPFLG